MSDELKIQLSLKLGQPPMLNVRENTANALQSLIDDLSKLPELAIFFRRLETAETGVAEVVAQENVGAASPEEEPTRIEEASATTAPTQTLSAIEIARQRMRGGK